MPRVVVSRRRLVARGKLVDNVVLPRPQVANSGSPQVTSSTEPKVTGAGSGLRNGLGVVLFVAMQLAAVIGICFLLGAWGRSIQNPLEAILFAAILLGIQLAARA